MIVGITTHSAYRYARITESGPGYRATFVTGWVPPEKPYSGKEREQAETDEAGLTAEDHWSLIEAVLEQERLADWEDRLDLQLRIQDSNERGRRGK